MMKHIATIPVQEPPLRFELTKDELTMLDAILDAGVRATGMRAVTPELLSIRAKINVAIKQASTEQEPPSGA